MGFTQLNLWFDPLSVKIVKVSFHLGLFLSISASPFPYLSTNYPNQIPAATINDIHSERTQFN
jgi:hypothetical protein